MKTKIILLSVVVILFICLVAGAFWWLRKPQVITFDNGDKITLLAMDYGKHHAPPGVKPPAPTSGTAPRARTARGAAFTTTNDTLVVWVREEFDAKQWRNFEYYIYDKAGAACVNTFNSYGGNGGNGVQVQGIRVDAFPRRQGKFLLRVQENGQNGQQAADKDFIISNPARRSFASLTADALPSTKSDDDVSVTLTKLVAGANMPYTRNNSDADDAMNKGVQATFNVSRNGKPVTTWQPVSSEVSDGTGNHVNGSIAKNDWNGNDDVVLFQYGLWPDEPAWMVRLEFSQQSDFSPEEEWSVQNVPLLPGRQQDFYGGGRRNNNGAVVGETDLNGVHVKVFAGQQFTDAPPNSNPQGGLLIQTQPQLPKGMRMTLKVTHDQTNNINFWDSGWNMNGKTATYRYGLQDISGLTNLNLTIVVHKSRYVEFTAKPTKE